ncbi:MAG: hypothetical protein CVU40_16600 [Chloroflexi bacterium HGW-Chloroflexi-2]|nr:MAG: hypothetical protein CVU40_16600 [Chloroflexi bacterium HGW-Chloroflexi-2]
MDSRDWIPNGCESGPESGRAKHWIVGIASRMVVNQILNLQPLRAKHWIAEIAPRMVVNQILNPDGRSIG